MDDLPTFPPIETAVHRTILVELLAEVAAIKPDARQWLARHASQLARYAAETQDEVPAGTEAGATELRSVVSQIFDGAANRLDHLLRDQGEAGNK